MSRSMARAPQKRALTTVDLGPRLDRLVEEAKSADEELGASRLIREALRHWVGESPQAMNSDELWVLKALRVLKQKDEALWAAALRSLSGFAEEFGAGMPASRYAELGEITATHKRDAEADRGQVRRTAGRKAPPSR